MKETLQQGNSQNIDLLSQKPLKKNQSEIPRVNKKEERGRKIIYDVERNLNGKLFISRIASNKLIKNNICDHESQCQHQILFTAKEI